MTNDFLARMRASLHVLRVDLTPRRARERGDVPGWVLITMMTAALVALLYGFAGDQLQALFSDAISRVRGI